MEKYFDVRHQNDWVKIRQLSKLPFYYVCIYIDNQLVATYYQGNTFYLYVGDRYQLNHLTISGFYVINGVPMGLSEQYSFSSPRNQQERDFKPGDILVASDNVNKDLTGYIGHSALVVDESNLIEAPGGHPAIQKDTIHQFLEKHPHHAQFRPKSSEIGEAAVGYAEKYLTEYKEKLDNGEEKPLFSMTLDQSLKDPWKYIYCSKLVWLSYFHGADYKMENDYLWFSPEDLFTHLQENDDFEKVYQHEKVDFKVNT
ncbi:hypothetical protein [Oceanobacillus halotolerans]|uniref:hypothetical protein n=1 Tax=Oceanobacillus halotolerans TaxID=2663380 RepID=UPI0013DA9A57|nr:hypothetical protein [Oceanobacillus halotolerans]